MPSYREHCTGEGEYGCWCDVIIYEVCEECDEGDGAHTSDCWQCGGKGLVPCPDPEAYDGPHGLVIVHEDETPPLDEHGSAA